MLADKLCKEGGAGHVDQKLLLSAVRCWDLPCWNAVVYSEKNCLSRVSYVKNSQHFTCKRRSPAKARTASAFPDRSHKQAKRVQGPAATTLNVLKN